MSACNFKIPFSGTADEVFHKAEQTIQSHGGKITGDKSAGQFNIEILGNRIAGYYQIHEQELNMTIDTKPFFVPCNAIESFLVKQLS